MYVIYSLSDDLTRCRRCVVSTTLKVYENEESEKQLRHLVLAVHLVELIDATDAVVGEHESARLDNHVVYLRVTSHGCGKTCPKGCVMLCKQITKKLNYF